MEGCSRHRNQHVQILGVETEMGVFTKLQASTMSGRNQEQESGLKCPADEVGLCSESGVAGVGRGGR